MADGHIEDVRSSPASSCPPCHGQGYLSSEAKDGVPEVARMVRKKLTLITVLLVLVGAGIGVGELIHSSTASPVSLRVNNSDASGTGGQSLALPPPATLPPPTPSCPLTGSVGSANLVTVTLSNASKSFAQPCYYASSSSPITMTLTNDIVNQATNLPVPYSVAISDLSHPAFGAGGNASSASPTAPLPSSELLPRPSNSGSAVSLPSGSVTGSSQAALFNSPTALNAGPVSFTFGPLPAGRYAIQLVPPSTSTTSVLVVS